MTFTEWWNEDEGNSSPLGLDAAAVPWGTICFAIVYYSFIINVFD